MEDQGVVVCFWALPLGGIVGALVGCFIKGFELPYTHTYESTGRKFWHAGFIGDVAIGPVAAMLVQGLSASTFATMGTAFTALGFWGPFVASAISGFWARKLLERIFDSQLSERAQELFSKAGDTKSP